MEFFLQDHVILITGASRGIGRALALACASQGATVILLARTIQHLESVYDEILQQHFPEPAIYPFNLATANLKDYQEMVKNIEQKLGRLDAVIHNAAVLGELSPLEHHSWEKWQQVLQVNLSSVFMLSQVTLPLLKKSPNPSMLFTTADVGLKARAYWGAYAVSKYGIQALMEILSDELEINTQIRVNAIQPGKVRSQLRSSAYPGESSLELKNPSDITEHYLKLLHPENQRRGETIILS